MSGLQLLIALDSASGKVLSTLPIGLGVDAAAYDQGTGLVFASSGDSTLTVAKADAAGNWLSCRPWPRRQDREP